MVAVVQWLILVFLLVLLPGTALLLLTRSFRVEQVRHRKDPSDFGIDFDTISFPTRNGRKLYGWWIPGKPDAPLLILVHGWKRNVERMLPLVPLLHQAGCSQLLFDARSHGSSDADGLSNMLKFSEDIRAAVDEGRSRLGEHPEIGIIGHSVGGAGALHAASFDTGISAVLSIGAFAHPGRLMRRDFRRKGIPAPIVSLLLKYISWKIGASFDEIAPSRRIGKIRGAVAIIHGENDVVVPVDHGRELAAAGPPGLLAWFMPGRGHSDCTAEEGFEEFLLDFFRCGDRPGSSNENDDEDTAKYSRPGI